VLRDAKARIRRPGPASVQPEFAMIGSRAGVTFHYPGARSRSLHEVSPSRIAGQVIALVGEETVGEDHLAKIRRRLYRPQSGTVRGTTSPIA